MSVIDNPGQIVWLDDEGILHAVTKPQSVLDLPEAEATIRQVGALIGGVRRPLIVDLAGLKSITREARAYFSGPATAALHSACALVVASPMSRAIGNFFLGLNKPLMPTRLFTSEALALAWLRQYLPRP